MNKETFFYFHIGNPKSASTSVQNVLKNLSDFDTNSLYTLGRFNGKNFAHKELRRLHYQIFKPNRHEILPYSISSKVDNVVRDIQSYCDLVYSIITKLPAMPRNIALSDECIIDAGNYEADQNLARLAMIIYMLKARFNGQADRTESEDPNEEQKSIKLTFKVSYAIRKQDDWLKSIISYQRNRGFRRESKRFFRAPHCGPYGHGFYWESYLKIVSIMPADVQIHIAPMELLKTNRALQFYLGLFPTLKDAFEALESVGRPGVLQTKSNSRSNENVDTNRASGVFILLKKTQILFAIQAKYSYNCNGNKLNISSMIFAAASRLALVGLWITRRVDDGIYKILGKLGFDDKVSFSPDDLHKIDEIYGPGNRQLEERFTHLGLKQLGYPREGITERSD